MQRCSRWMLDLGGRQIAGGHGNPSQSDTSLGTSDLNEFGLLHRDCPLVMAATPHSRSPGWYRVVPRAALPADVFLLEECPHSLPVDKKKTPA
jgi:hypothetical protein